MTIPENDDDSLFRDAIKGLIAGDFSRLEPLFNNDSPARHCRIIEWYEAGLFADQPKALAEALACACFLGCTRVAEYLLAQGIDPSSGDGTGLNGFHWAANRGNLETVRLLIRHKAPLETRNLYGGTVLGATVWAAINEPRGEQIRVIEELLKAGANINEAGYPTGDERIDKLIKEFL